MGIYRYGHSATGNHWWLDSIVGIMLLGVTLLIDTGGSRAALSTMQVRDHL
ncbi:MAG: hypothetical protein ACYC06_02625 [Ilumatobacteraceae bacterium]